MGRGDRTRSKAAPIVGAVVLWAAGWALLPGLDPEPRGDWYGRRRTVVTVAPDGDGLTADRRGGTIPRPWCPPCGLVEDHVTDNTWVNQGVGIGQLIGLAALSSAGLSLVDDRRSRRRPRPDWQPAPR